MSNFEKNAVVTVQEFKKISGKIYALDSDFGDIEKDKVREIASIYKMALDILDKVQTIDSNILASLITMFLMSIETKGGVESDIINAKQVAVNIGSAFVNKINEPDEDVTQEQAIVASLFAAVKTTIETYTELSEERIKEVREGLDEATEMADKLSGRGFVEVMEELGYEIREKKNSMNKEVEERVKKAVEEAFKEE